MARLIDALYDDDNFGICSGCEEEHVLCPNCGLCLKYCHDPNYCEAWDERPDAYETD